ncbi:MAG TPA: GatB/YqeY domain-containing protein [Aestuariivirgaceae bacterium]|nr:GatB/YqeY domain-containing protein [Aestuariivirgaceae bacterium]
MTSSLRERINIELKDAIRSQERRRMSTLRLVSAAIKDRMIQNRSAGKAEHTSDAEVREILAKMIKQRRDSTQAYEAGGRPELAQSEREEITIIEEFLPRQLSDDEIREAVRSVVAEVGGGLKDMGKVMAALKERYGGQMDMSRASALAKDMLS